MKKSDIIRLILFIFLGASIYFYMGHAVAAQVNNSPGISLNNSRLLWDAVNALENPWYPESFGRRQPEDPLPVVSLTITKENQLRSIVTKYDDLKILVDELIKLRKDGDLEGFIEQKEKIAQQLRPIWREAIYEKRRKEEKKKKK